MKLLILLTFFTQTDTLPPTQILLAKIDAHYVQKTKIELLEYSTSKKHEYLKYLPTFGLTYDIQGKPRPTLSFSSTTLYRAAKDKQSLKAKRQQIIQKNLLEAKAQKQKLLHLIQEFHALKKQYKYEKQIFQIDIQIFEIHKDKYERLEIAPLKFLELKRTFLQKEKHINEFKQKAIDLKNQILNSSH